MKQSHTPARLASCGLTFALAALLLQGCGQSGPDKYTATGLVTFSGKPIKYGDMMVEPKDGAKTNETISRAVINDGHYTVEVVGGPHVVNIRDLTGDPDMDQSGGGGKRLFMFEYRGTVDFPPLEEVKGGAPVEKNIEVPKTQK